MSRSVMLTASCTWLSALLVAAVPVSAQNPDAAPLQRPESIPFELAAALTSAGGMSGEPQILVGSVPGWVADRIVVPTNGRILGSAFYGTTVVAILTTPTGDDSLLAGFKRDLMKKGWLTAPPFLGYGGGFRPAIASGASSNRVALCSEGQSLSATVARRQGSMANITVRIAPVSPNSSCNPPQIPADYPRQAMLPTVYHPVGVMDARSASDCERAQEMNRNTAVVKSNMTPDALLDHYGRQLQDSGWVATTKPATTSARTFARPDSSGTRREIRLSISTAGSDNSCRELNMSLFSSRPQ